MTGRSRSLLRGGAAFLLALGLAVVPVTASALETTAPHVPDGADTDVCAMCHRGHSAASGATYRSLTDSATTGSALLIGPLEGSTEADLCYVCHGVEALGSALDVQSSFLSTSAHSLAPTASPYGPSAKSCASCHDSHGSERTPSGTVYPYLLRSYTMTDALVYGGDEYCATCHVDRVGDLWDGLRIWRATPHASEITTSAGGTGAVCSVCHDGHGSDVAPLIQTTLTPPAAGATVTVGNDRRLCLACHSGPLATFSGATSYAVSSHGLTEATVTAVGEWVSRYPTGSVGTTRLAGECENCHDPMGRADASGNLLPKMAPVRGRALCDRCHDADGPSSSNIASLAFPSSEVTAVELAVTWRPGTATAALGRVGVYSRDASGTAPRPLVGPREYTLPGEAGDSDWGDIDGDGNSELVVADPGSARITVFSFDPLRGLTRWSGPGVLSIAFSAEWLEVGDFVADGSGLPEIAVVDTATASMYVYRYNGSSLTAVSGPLAVGNGPSGIASGDVTGTAAADIIVTASADDAFGLFSESAGSVVSRGSFATSSTPRGPSVGDAWSGGTKDEIVIANSGEPTLRVTVFDDRGVALGSYDPGFAGAQAYDTLVADVLPGTTPAGTSGTEIIIAMYSTTGATGVTVFPQAAGGGLGTRQEYTSPTGSGSASLGSGDADGDGRSELALGNSGRFPPDATTAGISSFVYVYRADSPGTALDAASRTRLDAGGAEFAGGAPALAVADLGGVGFTRHPAGAVIGAHVSTEAPPSPRHVECPDCHDSHEATASAPATPQIGGRLAGASGVSVTNVSTSSITYAADSRADFEYEVCLKCHSSWSALGGSRDIAVEVNTLDPGEHAVEGAGNASAQSGTYEGGWGNTSVIACTDCHGQSRASAAAGPHSSTSSPLLSRPYAGVSPSSGDVLCFKCHKYAVYLTGTDDGSAGSTSNFYDTGAVSKLHSRHTYTRAFSCRACHVSHGSTTLPHLLRSDIGWASGSLGQCQNACHGGATKTYTGP